MAHDTPELEQPEGAEGGRRARGQSPERRVAPRYACKVRITIDGSEGARAVGGRLLDLSAGGCMIQPESALGVVADSELEFILDTGLTQFRARGVVRSKSAKTGALGVRFLTMSRRGRVDFEELIRELEGAKTPDRNRRAYTGSWDAT